MDQSGTCGGHDALAITVVGSNIAQPPVDQQASPDAPPEGSATDNPDHDVPPTLVATDPDESSARQARVPRMHDTPTSP